MVLDGKDYVKKSEWKKVIKFLKSRYVNQDMTVRELVKWLEVSYE